MIWLTWRQFRAHAAVLYGAIAVLAVLLAVTGLGLARQHRADGRNFLADIGRGNSTLYVVGVLAVLAAPVIIGMFWGAPLVTRELDAGTYRLAWTQTTRTRWLIAKLGVIGLAAVVAAGLLSLAVTWWGSPIDAAIAATKGLPGPGLLVFPRLSREIFDARGVAPVGYAAFAFALGVTVGVVIRRTLPAMAVVVVIFAVTQIVMSLGIRPNLAAPDRVTTPVTAANLLNLDLAGSLHVIVDEPGAWVSSQHTVNAAGQPARLPSSIAHCMLAGDAATGACLTRLTKIGYRQQVSYQPASRFWSFQVGETVIYLALALLLAGLCTWWMRHRLS